MAATVADELERQRVPGSGESDPVQSWSIEATLAQTQSEAWMASRGHGAQAGKGRSDVQKIVGHGEILNAQVCGLAT